jgi:EAL domain-containing protein (putative c-di-GMP-specific phosphodiesterase class I)
VRLLRGSPNGASRLIFEITETADAAHLDAACAFGAELTTLGCGLALDDFGVGFGSFTYLRKLPLRYLKIDRSFVRDVVRARDDRRTVQSIVGIARQFDLKVVAEGIEDEPTLGLVRELGIDYGQGFHLGRPAPLAAE